MNINLLTCILGIAIWLITFFIMILKINKQKKNLSCKNKTILKAEKSFSASLSLTLIIEFLPLLIPMKFFAETVACVCGILGAYIVLNERLINLKKIDEKE